MLRRLRVRGKILATLAVPVLVLFIGATILSIGSIAEARLATATKQFVLSLTAQDQLTKALQDERSAAFDLHAERADDSVAYEQAQARTNVTIAQYQQAVDKINVGPLDPRLVTALEAAKSARASERLNAVRSISLADDPGVRAKRVEALYGSVINAHLTLAEVAQESITDRALARVLGGYVALNETINLTSLDGKLAETVLEENAQGKGSAMSRRPFVLAITEGDTARRTAESTMDDLALPTIKMPSAGAQYGSMRTQLAIAESGWTVADGATPWHEQVQDELDKLIPVRSAVLKTAIGDASDASSAANQQAVGTIVSVIIGLVASVMIALLVARRITEPLRRLTEAAQNVREALPKLVEQVAVPGQGPETTFEPIPVEDNDEVGQLANAFNAVNEMTIDIAREQAVLRGSIADMFVNVARRDQVLLSRQLAFLDELERSEENPNTLANLFRLDHLATRMRRNAESLLVLAGIEMGRRVRDPMSLSDVIRTAASEIEQYDRIQLEIETDPQILGHNALAAAHLIAEILENATVFSNPGSPVLVSESEDPRWISVVVRDQGLGMSPEDIAEANKKASTYAGSEIAGASRLGLYVVGRLSYRLGAYVQFFNAEDDDVQGVSVRIMFPRALFIADADLPLREPIDPLDAHTRAATEAWVAPEPVDSGYSESAYGSYEEPSAALPVDIPALTDGSTSMGMPRRRTRVADPAASAPSEALMSEADSRDGIVLPPLASPYLPSDFTDGMEHGWSPDSAPVVGDSGYTPVQESPSFVPEMDLGADLAVSSRLGTSPDVPGPIPQRASMFSNFRTRGDLESLTRPEAPEQGTALVEQAPSADQPEQVEQLTRDQSGEITETFPVDINALQTRTARRQAIAALSTAAAFQRREIDPEQAAAVLASDQAAQVFEPEQVVPMLEPDAVVPVLEPDWTEQVQPGPEAAPPGLEPDWMLDQTGLDAETAPALFQIDDNAGQAPMDVSWNGQAVEEDTATGHTDVGYAGDHSDQGFAPAQDLVIPPEPIVEPIAGSFESAPALGDIRPAFSPVGSVTAQPAVQDTPVPARKSLLGKLRKKKPTPLPSLLPPEPSPTPSAVVAPPPVFAPAPATPIEPTGWNPDAPPSLGGSAGFTEPTGAAPVQEEFTPRTNTWSDFRASDKLPSSAPSESAFPTGAPQAVLPLAPDLNFIPDPQEQSWTPTFSDGSAGSDEAGGLDASAQLALRTGIQEQALTELSRLSTYRPNQMGEGGSSPTLTKRVRSDVPASTDDLSSQKIGRDAEELRSRLSAFVSATSRAREVTEQESSELLDAEQST